jgi:hypothetical protein
VAHVRRQAENNCKFLIGKQPGEFENNYTLYHSDVMIGNNYVLVTMGNVKASYLGYHTFNAMQTTNSNFNNENENWLKVLVRKSTQISGVAEKQRYQFFKKIEDNLRKLREKIEKG